MEKEKTPTMTTETEVINHNTTSNNTVEDIPVVQTPNEEPIKESELSVLDSQTNNDPMETDTIKPAIEHVVSSPSKAIHDSEEEGEVKSIKSTSPAPIELPTEIVPEIQPTTTTEPVKEPTPVEEALEDGEITD